MHKQDNRKAVINAAVVDNYSVLRASRKQVVVLNSCITTLYVQDVHSTKIRVSFKTSDKKLQVTLLFLFVILLHRRC